MIKNVIVEGVDQTGKSTLIAGLQDRLGYFHVVHYQKPQRLSYYQDLLSDQAEEVYQRDAFKSMFNLLASPVRIICDRSHLGEVIYAPMYRRYSGDYVYELEQSYPEVCNDTLLVLLYTSSFKIINDDGKSIDVNKREDEQRLFLKAFHRSFIKHKLTVDVYGGNGSFRSSQEILDEVCVKLFTSV